MSKGNPSLLNANAIKNGEDKGSINLVKSQLRPNTKIDKVRTHLEAGKSISPIEALNNYGSFRLSGIIANLRERGYNIRTDMETYPATGSRFARYTLIKPKSE